MNTSQSNVRRLLLRKEQNSWESWLRVSFILLAAGILLMLSKWYEMITVVAVRYTRTSFSIIDVIMLRDVIVKGTQLGDFASNITFAAAVAGAAIIVLAVITKILFSRRSKKVFGVTKTLALMQAAGVILLTNLMDTFAKAYTEMMGATVAPFLAVAAPIAAFAFACIAKRSYNSTQHCIVSAEDGTLECSDKDLAAALAGDRYAARVVAAISMMLISAGVMAAPWFQGSKWGNCLRIDAWNAAIVPMEASDTLMPMVIGYVPYASFIICALSAVVCLAMALRAGKGAGLCRAAAIVQTLLTAAQMVMMYLVMTGSSVDSYSVTENGFISIALALAAVFVPGKTGENESYESINAQEV